MKLIMTLQIDPDDPMKSIGVDIDVPDALLSDPNRYGDLCRFLKPAFGNLAFNLGYDPILAYRARLETLANADAAGAREILNKLDAIVAGRGHPDV
jgi:hypothetical protein